MDRHATQSNTRRQYSEADSFNRAIKGPRMTQVTGMAHTITYFMFLYIARVRIFIFFVRYLRAGIIMIFIMRTARGYLSIPVVYRTSVSARFKYETAGKRRHVFR